jgi:hypothetical protein
MRDELPVRLRVFAANTRALYAHRPHGSAGRLALIKVADNDRVGLVTERTLSPAFEHWFAPATRPRRARGRAARLPGGQREITQSHR